MVPALADLLKVNKKWCSFAGGTILVMKTLHNSILKTPFTQAGA